MLSGDKLKFLRINKRLTQKQIAEYVGVTERFVKMVENWERKPSQESYDKWIEGIYTLEPKKKSTRKKEVIRNE